MTTAKETFFFQEYNTTILYIKQKILKSRSPLQILPCTISS